MADVEAYFPLLDFGIDNVQGYGVQGPEQADSGLSPVVDMQNLIPFRGALRAAWKWTALTDTSLNPSIDGSNVSRQQFSYSNAQYVVDAIVASTGRTGEEVYIVLTDGEIFVNGTSMNPTYAPAGLVHSPPTVPSVIIEAVIGSLGMLARGIIVGDLLYIDVEGLWYSITEVSGDSQLSIDQALTIGDEMQSSIIVRRTFARGTSMGTPSMCIMHGDLYVACQCAGNDPSGTAQSDWCILRVADIFGTPVTSYVLSTWDTTGSLSAESIIASLTNIYGMQPTQDGRLVILCQDSDLGTIVRWSNILDTNNNAVGTDEWITTPAGFVEIQGAIGDGKAFCRIGEVLIAYYANSIHIGTPTGQSDPPFTWTKSKAKIGTRWQRAVQEVPYGNLFVGTDGNLRLFDGNGDQRLTDLTISRWTRGSDVVRQPTYTFIGIEAALAPLEAAIGTVTVT